MPTRIRNDMRRRGESRNSGAGAWRHVSARGLILAAAALAASIAAVTIAAAVDSGEVDTALIVAIDVSNSVDDQRYKLQMEGIAQALEDPGVIQAIVGGAKGGILFSLITWADQPTVNMPWTHIASEADARAAAMRVRQLPRQGGEFTCMARMMRIVSDKIVTQMPTKAVKVVLDVSGDGRDNCNEKEPIDHVRDELVQYGVTVNGLPILGGEGPEIVTPGKPATQSYLPDQQQADPLEDWYREHVKGGPGSFVLPANGYADFGRAIRQKFVLEVSGLPSRVRQAYSTYARSRFLTLSKLRALSLPRSDRSRAEFTSAALKLVSVTSAPVKSAPASSLPMRLAPLRLAPRSVAYSITARARLASLKEAPSRLVERKTPRINPID